MPTLMYVNGPQDGVQHAVTGAKPPPVRYWAAPGDRAQTKVWVDLHRYALRQAVEIGRFVYEYTGRTSLIGPIPSAVDELPGWS